MGKRLFWTVVGMVELTYLKKNNNIYLNRI